MVIPRSAKFAIWELALPSLKVLDGLAEEAQLAVASADICPVVIFALEWLALGVNLGAGRCQAGIR
jgi:hypothetical protein